MTANGYRVSLRADENDLKLRLWLWLHNSVNMLRDTDEWNLGG